MKSRNARVRGPVPVRIKVDSKSTQPLPQTIKRYPDNHGPRYKMPQQPLYTVLYYVGRLNSRSIQTQHEFELELEVIKPKVSDKVDDIVAAPVVEL